MVFIPDYQHDQLPTDEEIAAHNAAIDAEIAESQAAALQEAINELNAVPSYVERFARHDGEE